MKISINNQDYLIKFKHHYPVNISKRVSTLGTHVFIPHKLSYGSTECSIQFQDHEISHGVANCSKKDNFCKHLGRELSLKRALEHSTFSKSERKNIWDVYNNRNKN